MKTYTFPITEIQFGSITVKANNAEQALELAQQQYHEGETNWGEPHVHIGGKLEYGSTEGTNIAIKRKFLEAMHP